MRIKKEPGRIQSKVCNRVFLSFAAGRRSDIRLLLCFSPKADVPADEACRGHDERMGRDERLRKSHILCIGHNQSQKHPADKPFDYGSDDDILICILPIFYSVYLIYLSLKYGLIIAQEMSQKTHISQLFTLLRTCIFYGMCL